MNRIRQLLSEASAAFGRLSNREKNLVALTALVVVGFLVFVTAFSVNSALNRRQETIKSKRAEMAEVQRLTAGFRSAEAKRNELEGKLRDNRVQLISHLDELAKSQGVTINGISDKGTHPVGDSKITESSVEVTFTQIGLEKLVTFLTRVESGKGIVKVTNLRIRPRPNETVLDAWFTVTSYQLKS